MTEVKHEEATTEMVEPQAVKLADASEENAAETRTAASTPSEPSADVVETGVGEAQTATVDEKKETEGRGEEWADLQEQLAQLNSKLESLSRKVSKLSASSNTRPSAADESEVVAVGGLKVTSPPAQVAKEKRPLLRRRARAAKKLPRPKRRKVGRS